jgi:hypothetical protein
VASPRATAARRKAAREETFESGFQPSRRPHPSGARLARPWGLRHLGPPLLDPGHAGCHNVCRGAAPLGPAMRAFRGPLSMPCDVRHACRRGGGRANSRIWRLHRSKRTIPQAAGRRRRRNRFCQFPQGAPRWSRGRHAVGRLLAVRNGAGAPASCDRHSRGAASRSAQAAAGHGQTSSQPAGRRAAESRRRAMNPNAEPGVKARLDGWG